MRTPRRLALAATAAAFLIPKMAEADAVRQNPFFTESTLPFNFPPFDKIRDSDYAPAFERGMADHLKEVEAIADNPEKPTFDNTIVALEKSGRLLQRVADVFDDMAMANADDTIDAVDAEMAPKRSAQNDEVSMNPRLFARIRGLYDERASLGLDPESLRLLEKYYDDFVRAGAKLSDADKEKLKRTNARIAELMTTFSQNVRKESNASTVFVRERSDLAGMSEAEIATAASAADSDGHRGEFALPLSNTTGQPVLASLTNRALRERIMQVSLARGSRGGLYDNQSIVISLARLRAEKAALLGFDSFAAYVVADQTAHTVGAVYDLLGKLVGPAVEKSRREAAEMQAIIDREQGGFQLASWDWELYSERVRRAKYSFDESQLRPYFELNHVLFDGVFYAANKLYGITFKEVHDFPVYQPDVRTFEVFDSDGKPLAMLLEDFYARPSKKGGAWMNEFVHQSTLLGRLAVVGNHHNIPKPAQGEPTLLTFDEVTGLFHEFGHGLHAIFSRVRYPYFAGTAVPTDFVEYPSQVNEMWAAFPDVVRNYAKNYRTGEPMPQELLDKMVATQKFNQGHDTLEYVKATLLDEAWHTIRPDRVPDNVPEFEAAAFGRYGATFEPVPPRYRSTYFLHAFSDGYEANYYSYLWADVLVADSIEWFKAHGGLDRRSGQHFRDTVLSHGGSVDSMTLFREFTGSAPDVAPLIRRRGLDEAN